MLHEIHLKTKRRDEMLDITAQVQKLEEQMPVSKSFKEYPVDQLVELGFVTVKKIFGGAGIHGNA